MILQERSMMVQDARLTLTAANFAQQTVRCDIPRSWPVEEILVVAQFTIAAAANTGSIAFGLLNALRRVQLEVTEPGGPRTVVNVTGPGLLQHISNEGLSLDRSTLQVMAATNQGFLKGTGVYRCVYRIPLVHPSITGALRPRMLLPVHLHPQNPQLVLEFASAAEMFSSVADPFTAANVEVHLIQRDMPRAYAQAINDETKGSPWNWFVRSDIQETIFPISVSQTNSEQRFAIPQPGQYSGLTIYMEKGNSTLTIDDISANTTVGQETLWRIESGGSVLRAWRNKILQARNDSSRAVQPLSEFNLNVLTAASPKLVTSATAVVSATAVEVMGANFGGPGGTGLATQAPASIFHDFLTDGVTDSDELGSLLDCNAPTLSGLKMEIVGNVTTPANQASNFKVVGRRSFGDLSRWQSVARLAAA